MGIAGKSPTNVHVESNSERERFTSLVTGQLREFLTRLAAFTLSVLEYQ